MEMNCLNCINFKTRFVTPKILQRRECETNKFWKFYQFPISVLLLNRLDKYKECRIFYCKYQKMKREVYIDNAVKKLYYPIEKPCSCYK